MANDPCALSADEGRELSDGEAVDVLRQALDRALSNRATRRVIARATPVVGPAVCAWCGVELKPGAPDGPVSHGCCTACAERVAREAELP
ncbi:MAG: hypothetical protein Q8L86_10210 [Vicinamibacterales bacterium]|nr:hypothetical protein [Vicinamibacterales bacterium]